MHCRYCFKCFAQIEKHETKCESEPTVKSLSRVVRELLDRVETQERTIDELKRGRTTMTRTPVELPVLTESDLKLFLFTGIDSMVAAHVWPVAVHNRTTYVCESSQWIRANDTQLKTQVGIILSQLATLFQIYVERKGWIEFDPKGKFPELSMKIYGIKPTVVQQSILKKAKA